MGVTLTLHATYCAYSSTNVRKNELHILYYHHLRNALEVSPVLFSCKMSQKIVTEDWLKQNSYKQQCPWKVQRRQQKLQSVQLQGQMQ